MDYHPTKTAQELPLQLIDELISQRRQRNFSSTRYIAQKAQLLNTYLATHGRNTVVVAVSGGIDSAVVLGVTSHAAAQPESPIEKIVPLCLPVIGIDQGATNQEPATSRGQEVAAAFGLDAVVVDLAASASQMRSVLDTANQIPSASWSRGQLVAYLRTPAIYYTTSLLTQAGHAPVVAGTTNLDEGGYLGYFGKASDGLVDLQLIADLHKSQVFSVGRTLCVPSSILETTPAGDMFDGRPDEEVFGAPYDFVEMYIELLISGEVLPNQAITDPASLRAQLAKREWSDQTITSFIDQAINLEGLHSYNSHKYRGHSPAVHLDLRDVTIPSGWQFGTWPGNEVLPNTWDISDQPNKAY
jgi:NAD+ synthetase